MSTILLVLNLFLPILLKNSKNNLYLLTFSLLPMTHTHCTVLTLLSYNMCTSPLLQSLSLLIFIFLTSLKMIILKRIKTTVERPKKVKGIVKSTQKLTKEMPWRRRPKIPSRRRDIIYIEIRN